MVLCPQDLASCSRKACAGGVCQKTGEPLMAHCYECGTFVAWSRVVICRVCIAAKPVKKVRPGAGKRTAR